MRLDPDSEQIRKTTGIVIGWLPNGRFICGCERCGRTRIEVANRPMTVKQQDAIETVAILQFEAGGQCDHWNYYLAKYGGWRRLGEAQPFEAELNSIFSAGSKTEAKS